jgi:hypothetical protein
LESVRIGFTASLNLFCKRIVGLEFVSIFTYELAIYSFRSSDPQIVWEVGSSTARKLHADSFCSHFVFCATHASFVVHRLIKQTSKQTNTIQQQLANHHHQATMFPNRSLLLITFLTSCNVASAAASSTNLRGSGDVSSSITAISSSHVDKEERQLKPDHAGGGGGGGKGKNKEETTTTTTVAPSIPETGGGAEAPLPGTTTSTVAPAVCSTSCGAGEICAREGPTSEPQCYTECVAFPLAVKGDETCGTEGDKCVSNLDVNDVYIEWCDCEADGKWGCASK